MGFRVWGLGLRSPEGTRKPSLQHRVEVDHVGSNVEPRHLRMQLPRIEFKVQGFWVNGFKRPRGSEDRA